jgi:hypothetical protein
MGLTFNKSLLYSVVVSNDKLTLPGQFAFPEAYCNGGASDLLVNCACLPTAASGDDSSIVTSAKFTIVPRPRNSPDLLDMCQCFIRYEEGTPFFPTAVAYCIDTTP